MIDHNIAKTSLMPAHSHKNETNPVGKYFSLIFHNGSVATILWSDDKKKLNIQVRKIDIVTKFNSFIQRSCE